MMELDEAALRRMRNATDRALGIVHPVIECRGPAYCGCADPSVCVRLGCQYEVPAVVACTLGKFCADETCVEKGCQYVEPEVVPDEHAVGAERDGAAAPAPAPVARPVLVPFKAKEPQFADQVTPEQMLEMMLGRLRSGEWKPTGLVLVGVFEDAEGAIELDYTCAGPQRISDSLFYLEVTRMKMLAAAGA